MERKVRASMGTLGVLGLELVAMDTPPTTAYLQIYTEKRCAANCLFCAQARGSSAELTHIARGMYMPADLEAVVQRLGMAYDRKYLARACIQTALYDEWWDDTVYLIKRIHEVCEIPLSLSVFPLADEKYKELKSLGVNEIVIPLDASTPALFDKIKGTGAGGPYSWEGHIDGLKRAARIFGNIGTHLIIGMGETDEEAVRVIDELQEHKINTALFSYTYVPGAQMSIRQDNKESIRHYRTVQLVRYLITEGKITYKEMRFSDGVLYDFGVKRSVIIKVIEDGSAFQTSGCPDCNRPMANETFSMIYNFPRIPDEIEKEEIKRELGGVL
ncbi:MAG: radical SAM protein [Methanosarcinales archaeon]|nr:MAG: radical SAM protein [Methanosarcinales archaeon]